MRLIAGLLAALGVAGAASAQSGAEVLTSRGLSATTPGCGVGVTRDGVVQTRFELGLADLEHRAPLTPSSVFEAGSGSKQFTAAAVLLLAEEGRLSLDDSVRCHLPELPAHADAITLADLIGHSSGLRDWRWIRGLAGWPLGTAVHTNADILTVASRQAGLNHAPGEAYAYTNTGYNLLALIVERVAGESLADYSRRRIFTPLGMASTQWRDNFRAVVPNRAVAYRRDRASGDYFQDMPFENAYGAGGLLTTVDDLLRWHRALDDGALGPGVTEALQRSGVLRSGAPTGYAGGLSTRRFLGVEEIGHGGATAGYVSYVARYPSQGVSVVVLCNTSEVNPRLVAEALVTPVLEPAEPGPAQTPPDAPVSTTGENEPLWRPDAAELGAVAGLYRSAEVGVDYRMELRGGRLWLVLDGVPANAWSLSPTYKDSLVFNLGRIRLERTGQEVSAFTIELDRARGVRFTRVGD